MTARGFVQAYSLGIETLAEDKQASRGFCNFHTLNIFNAFPIYKPVATQDSL